MIIQSKTSENLDKRKIKKDKELIKNNTELDKIYSYFLVPKEEKLNNRINYSTYNNFYPKKKTKKQGMKNNHSQKNIKDENYSFKPQINKNSIKISEKLGSTSSRLFKKKYEFKKEEIIEISRKNYVHLFGNKVINNNNNNYQTKQFNTISYQNLSKSPISSKKVDEFYRKQIEAQKQKEKLCIENQIKKESEYLQYPYRPSISHYPDKNNIFNKTSLINTNSKTVNIFNRLYKPRKRNDIRKCKHDERTISNNSLSRFAFKPEISPLKIKDDQNVIRQNINQINFYVQKRRKSLENKKNVEEYKNKKLGIKFGPFRPVIMNGESELRTEKRFNSKNGKNKKYLITKGTMDLCSEPFINKNEKIYYYLNDENDDMKINIIKINSKNRELNQEEFLNAINNLHNQIGNLNI
jgi:hypothetical protein